ncbi:hypothetical protein GN244_ATG00056 [Phytophthora infestans]|uniref:Uncharacterized protein n=1 Tax=Phytophthora infestans TaxID=4787 RepID=A0A833SEW6_PHYIN|nr:hypothetical protein GN244_ATG00056 [Phytophthora infestans]
MARTKTVQISATPGGMVTRSQSPGVTRLAPTKTAPTTTNPTTQPTMVMVSSDSAMGTGAPARRQAASESQRPATPMEQAAVDSADGVRRQARNNEPDEAHDSEDDVPREPEAVHGTATRNRRATNTDRDDGDAAVPVSDAAALVTAMQQLVTTMARLESRVGAMETTHVAPVAPVQRSAASAQESATTIVQQLAPARRSPSPLAARVVQAAGGDGRVRVQRTRGTEKIQHR